MNREFENWQKDLQGFLAANESNPPPEISQRLKDLVSRDLNPPVSRVLGKLLFINLLTGAASLAICPQLGIGPIGGGHGLMGIVMHMGSWVCASFCGGFFMGTTALACLLALRPEEARVVFRSSLWAFPVLCAFSFGSLMTVGEWAGRTPHYSLDTTYLLFWLGSALLVSVLVYRGGYRLRWGTGRSL